MKPEEKDSGIIVRPIDILKLEAGIGSNAERELSECYYEELLAPLKRAMEQVQEMPENSVEFFRSIAKCQELMLDFIQMQKDQFCAAHVLYANTHRIVMYKHSKWEEGANIITGGRIALVPKDLPYKPEESELNGSKYPNTMVVWMCSPKTMVEYWEKVFSNRNPQPSPIDIPDTDVV